MPPEPEYQRGPTQGDYEIRIMFGPKGVNIQVNSNETFGSIKEKFKKATALHNETILLQLQGHILEDYQTAGQVNLTHKSTLIARLA